MGVYLWTDTLEYDFTKSDCGWSVNGSAISRNSSGFYISGKDVDGYIVPPSNIYLSTPSKITITFNRYGNGVGVSGTGIYAGDGNNWYFLPRNSGNNSFDWDKGGTITQHSISLTSTSDMTWELDIDNSTTNWTIVHKITGNNNITDTSGTLKYLWENGKFGLRLVHWYTSGIGPYIKKVKFE